MTPVRVGPIGSGLIGQDPTLRLTDAVTDVRATAVTDVLDRTTEEAVR